MWTRRKTPRRTLFWRLQKLAPRHEVFAESMLEDNAAHQRRSPLDWLLSIGIHFAILALLLILPLYFTTRLNFQKAQLNFSGSAGTASCCASSSPSLLRPRSSPLARRLHAHPSRTTDSAEFIPKVVAMASVSSGPPPDEALMGVSGGIPGGQIGGVSGGVLGGVVGGFSNAAPPSSPIVARRKIQSLWALM